MEKRERNSAIELLRIATIILIIFHHFNVHGIRGARRFCAWMAIICFLYDRMGWQCRE